MRYNQLQPPKNIKEISFFVAEIHEVFLIFPYHLKVRIEGLIEEIIQGHLCWIANSIPRETWKLPAVRISSQENCKNKRLCVKHDSF